MKARNDAEIALEVDPSMHSFKPLQLARAQIALVCELFRPSLGLPESRRNVSKKEIFSALSLDLGKDAKAEAMREALKNLAIKTLGSGCRWQKAQGGRSLEKGLIA